MRVGFHAGVSPSGGGVYQWSRITLDCLLRHDRRDRYVVFFSDKDFLYPGLDNGRYELAFRVGETSLDRRFALMESAVKRWGRVALRFAKMRKVFKLALGRAPRAWPAKRRQDAPDFDRVSLNLPLQNAIEKHSVDLMIHATLTKAAFEVDIPYVVMVHDVQHRIQPMFREVSYKNEWNKREYIFRHGIERALFVLVDSEAGKEDVLDFYDVPESKVRVLRRLPYFGHLVNVDPQQDDAVLRKYQLQAGYLFYPAMFWPHKNHAHIVRALHLLKKRHGIELTVVFVGAVSDQWGALEEVQYLVEWLGLRNQVKYLGYVSEGDMVSLYRKALALVMPTYFGPTNTPVDEAFALGCPVITSDLRGIREQVGDAGLLIDPRSVEDIATAILRVYTDVELRNRLVSRGFYRAQEYTDEDYARTLLEILEDCERSLGSSYELAAKLN